MDMPPWFHQRLAPPLPSSQMLRIEPATSPGAPPEWMKAIHELTVLQAEQIQAVITGDSDFGSRCGCIKRSRKRITLNTLGWLTSQGTTIVKTSRLPGGLPQVTAAF